MRKPIHGLTFSISGPLWGKSTSNPNDIKKTFFCFSFLLVMIHALSTSCEIAFIWMSQNTFNDKSTLVQVMAWCHQAASHYINQWGPRSLLPSSVSMQQWVNVSSLVNWKLELFVKLYNFPHHCDFIGHFMHLLESKSFCRRTHQNGKNGWPKSM